MGHQEAGEVSVDGTELVTETARVVGTVDYNAAIMVCAVALLAMTVIVCMTVFDIYDRKKNHEALLDARAYELEKKRLEKMEGT